MITPPRSTQPILGWVEGKGVIPSEVNVMNPFSASKSDFPTNFLFFPIYSDDGSICHKECEENIRNSGNKIKQRKYSLEEYQKAMELLRRHGLRKVSKILGIPVSTLRDWRKGKHKPPLMRWTPKPCPELAYIIGCLLSDAWVYATDNGDYRICLETKDKDYAENFNRCMAKVLNKKPRRIYLRKKRKYCSYTMNLSLSLHGGRTKI